MAFQHCDHAKPSSCCRPQYPSWGPGTDADAVCVTLTCDECFCYLADALVEALDSGTLQLERNGPIQKSARGVWMRYDFDAAGEDLHVGSLWRVPVCVSDLPPPLQIRRHELSGDPRLPPVPAGWSKWCRTCRIWRPPRSSHCNICGVCVVRDCNVCVLALPLEFASLPQTSVTLLGTRNQTCVPPPWCIRSVQVGLRHPAPSICRRNLRF